jgi:molybdenum cofactor biosynthesis protein B
MPDHDDHERGPAHGHEDDDHDHADGHEDDDHADGHEDDDHADGHDHGHEDDDHGASHDHGHEDDDHADGHEGGHGAADGLADHSSDHGASHDHAHDHGHGHDTGPVVYGVLTVSSTRSIAEDTAGDAVVAAVEDDGGEVAIRELVTDDLDGVQSAVDRMADRADVDAVVTVGGTGVTPDDVTVEAVRPLFSKELPGFGELFRSLSYDTVGTATIASRATAGIVDRTPVFCLPGSEDAARLGARRLVVSEAAHLVGLATR